jgi:hypothetical protein
MSKDKTNEAGISRRGFLGKAMAGAVTAAGFSCVGLKAAVAENRAAAAGGRAAAAGGSPAVSQARALGKPPLNVATLNSTLQNRAQLGLIGADPKRFLKEHFSLTPTQLKEVEGLRSDELAAIRQALDAARRDNLSVSADCIGPGFIDSKQAQVVVQTSRIRAVKPGATAGNMAPGVGANNATAMGGAAGRTGGTLKITLSGFAQ